MQILITYLLVLAAALWVLWSVLLPKAVKRAVKARFSGVRATNGGGCGPDCGCGD